MAEQKEKYAARLKALGRKAAADGMVLLKNEDGMLPFKEEDTVSVFGRCQIDYYRSGTGSGGSVNVEYTTNLLDSLRESGKVRINEELAAVYQDWVRKNPADNGNGLFGSQPGRQAEMPLTEEIVTAAAALSGKALIVIGRTAGEEQENADEDGGYRLTEVERNMVSLVTSRFSQTAVIFNTSGIVDMSWTDRPGIKAILYAWQGGVEGGNGAADILTGKVTPSGGLTDTVAFQLSDYPAHANYGSEVRNFYQEDIYVGYRYFETFCPERVRYPFGFGLSYTTFERKLLRAQMEGEDAEAAAVLEYQITNTGSLAGREVLQIYLEAPQGRLGKPRKVLAGFAKTALLEPKESGYLRLRIPFRKFASYDDGGATGNRSCFVLEEGDYRLHAGRNCRDTEEITADGKAFWHLDRLVVTEKLQEAAAPVREFTRMKPEVAGAGYTVSYEDVPRRAVDIRKRIEENLPRPLAAPAKAAVTFQDVKAGNASLEDLAASLSPAEMAVMVLGEGMCNARVTSGTAAAFGGVCDELTARGIPAACASDGPSGIRRDTGEKAFQLPIGTMLACSFDVELMEELFYLEGLEILENRIDTLLGPGMNIHRYPVNGRNFEYYSEDPYLTGAMGAACVRGLNRAGVRGTIKHFACNNQEKGRHTADAVVSERALREIYLRGFEMAVKEGGACSVMTTYNPLNGFQNACGYDLNTTILRKEWGYRGIVMTDWWARLNNVTEGGKAGWTDVVSMLRAQNDIYMVVNNNGAVVSPKKEAILKALETGELTLGELQRSALNILRFLLSVPAAEREVRVPAPAAVMPLSDIAESEKQKARSDGRISADQLAADQNGVLLRVRKEGLYSLLAEYTAAGTTRDQMLLRLSLNDVPADLQTNGTHGQRLVQRVCRLRLREGYYRLTARHLRPGITLVSVRLTAAEGEEHGKSND